MINKILCQRKKKKHKKKQPIKFFFVALFVRPKSDVLAIKHGSKRRVIPHFKVFVTWCHTHEEQVHTKGDNKLVNPHRKFGKNIFKCIVNVCQQNA